MFPGFPKGTRKFLRELKKNNNREWFLANKLRYESDVKEPLRAFVSEIAGELSKIAPELETDPAKCIFRIYRDVRFSQDKSPYKTNIAAVFNPIDLKDRSAACLYFHLEPDTFFIGAGMYKPGSAELMAVRKAIAEHPEKLRKVLQNSKFKEHFGELHGEKLSREPRGFPANHAAMELLRFKQYLAYKEMPPQLAETPDLQPTVLKLFALSLPLVRFLNESLQRVPAKFGVL